MFSNHHIKTGLHSPLLIQMTCTFTKNAVSSYLSEHHCSALATLQISMLQIQNSHIGVSQEPETHMACTKFVVICPKSVFLQVPAPANGTTQEGTQGACKAPWCIHVLCPLWSMPAGSWPSEFVLELLRDASVGVSSYWIVFPDKDAMYSNDFINAYMVSMLKTLTF